MIYIDGSFGEGGGQVLRSSLSLSMTTGQAFEIDHIRAKRTKPGLLRQHLTCVQAAQAVCDAEVQGAELRSQKIIFRPQKIKGGNYHFSIGSAGSAGLVFQTIFPALLLAKGPSKLTIKGGTHNPMAPPFDFLQKCFAPVVESMGSSLNLNLERYGFYPAGGGSFSAVINPSPLKPLDLVDRGSLKAIRAHCYLAHLPYHIAQRELNVVRKKLELEEKHLKPKSIKNSDGPGNMLCIEIESENITEVFCHFGEKGISSEAVAEQACQEAKVYLESKVPVGQHFADQLLLLMSLAGSGRFRTLKPTQHTKTHREVIQKFLKINIEFEAVSDGVFEIRVG